MEEMDLFKGFLESVENWIADSCLILTNEQQMCINIISCIVLLKIITRGPRATGRSPE